MSEAIIDRIAFRVESQVIDGVANVSFSGYFLPDDSLEKKDAIVDQLMAVAERQRAKQIVSQLMAEKSGKQTVVDQEKARLGSILKDAETQKANGGLQDATNAAMNAAQQNIKRREEEVLMISVKIEALKPFLRETAPTPGD